MENDIRIKLSADAGQVRSELQDIDNRIKSLGGTQPSGSSSNPRDSQNALTGNSSSESMEALFRGLLSEVSIIRRQVENFRGSTSNPTDSTGSVQNSGNPQNGTSSDNNSQINSQGLLHQSQNPLQSYLGGLLTRDAIIHGIQRAFGYFSEGAKSSAKGESLAYEVLGKTSEYSDYFKAKKDAKLVGDNLGYSYEEVLHTQGSNMSYAGYVDKESLRQDTSAILMASKTLGISPQNLSSSSGRLSALGAFSIGEQKQFTELLAGSIAEMNMTGRESEQLRVLENIAETLGKTLVKVDESSMEGMIQLYSSLSSVSPELRGERGASIVESIHNSIVSGGSTLDVLMGYGTQYTGLSGRIALEREKERGLSDIETLNKIIENFESFTGQKIYSDAGQMMLHSQFGLTFEQIDSLLSARESGKSLTIEELKQSGKGSLSDKYENYSKSDVRAQEQYEIEKQDTKENFGESTNNFFNIFRKFYNGMSEGERKIVDVVGIAAGTTGTVAAANAGSKMLGGLFGGSAAPTLASQGGGFLGSLGGFAKTAGKAAPYVATAIELVDTVYDVYEASERGDSRKVSEEVGEGVGGVTGMWAGSAAGGALGTAVPIVGNIVGGVVGGIIGFFGGSAIGGAVGKGGYDLFSGGDKYDFTDEEKIKLQGYYSEVERLYTTKGNDSAQDYTLNEIVPYLKSIGVSTSITDEYNTDVGRPDFMNHIEDGTFGNIYQLQNVPPSKFFENLRKPFDTLKMYKEDKESNNNSSSSLDININLSGKLEGVTKENQDIIVTAVVEKIKENSFKNLLSRQFTRIQNS